MNQAEDCKSEARLWTKAKQQLLPEAAVPAMDT